MWKRAQRVDCNLFQHEKPYPVVARESGWIENDEVKKAVLFSEAAEPVEGVSFAKVVICGIDVVEEKVLASPVEVYL